MQISFLIVTKNRAEELSFTLHVLKHLVDLSLHEVLVLVDGCKQTAAIINNFEWVRWTVLNKSVSASPARNMLYKKAKGDVFIGLDDDAHPLSNNFISQIEADFKQNNNLGIIAFQEVRGVFKSDKEAKKWVLKRRSYLTNDFVGCGFAVKRAVYNKTNGFPVWVDIYGEESALAIEVLDLGYDIKYNNEIIVNHRVDVAKRQLMGRNYFRFERQLKNTMRYYLIYHSNPFFKIAKALFHNFKKYALKDLTYFKSYVKVIFNTITNFSAILKHRKPVSKSTIAKQKQLQPLKY